MTMFPRIKLPVFFFFLLFISVISAQSQTNSSPRERISMDSGWRFAFGHPSDTDKDFTNGTGYFSYLAKAGYGDGAASKNFDDRTWRKLDVPHDWAVELPFSNKGTHSHGYKALAPTEIKLTAGQ